MNSNSTNDSNSELKLWDSPYSMWFLVIIWGTMGALSLETIIGNAFVLMAYHCDRTIRKQINNRYILSLAVSDMIIGIEGFPFFTLFVANGERWPLGSFTCQTWLFLDYTLCLVSIVTVLLITVDRYLSVCYTAKYLKWQSPTKVKWMIFMSWILPALFFAIMIYGWKFMTGESIEDPTACYAPFLNDPFVNMTMYLVYYWSTLIAMLILYRGIHTTARNLEKKGEAREKRNIALLMGQRLGAQVGVTLLFQGPGTPQTGVTKDNCPSESLSPERQAKVKPADSGYNTETTAATTHIHSSPQVAATEPLLEVSTPSDSSQKTFPDIVEKHSLADVTSGFSLDFYGDDISLPSAFLDQSLSSLLTLNYPLPKLGENLSNGGFDLIWFDDPASVNPRKLPLVHKSNSNPITMESIKRNYGSYTTTDGLLLRKIDSLSSNNSIEQPLVPATVHRSLSGKAVITHSSSSGFESQKIEEVPTPLTKRGSGESAKFELIRKDSVKSAVSVESSVSGSSKGDIEVEERPRASSRVTRAQNKVKALAKKISRINLHKSSTSEKTFRTVKEETKTSSSKTDGTTKDSGEDREASTGTPDMKELNEANEIHRIQKQQSKQQVNEGVAESTVEEIKEKDKEKDKKRHGLMSNLFGPILRKRRKKTKAEKRARKAFRTITFIVGAFAVFWSPYFIVATIYGFCPTCIPSIIFNASYYMCYLNSSGNPFAYALANRQFKTAFLRILRGNFKKT